MNWHELKDDGHYNWFRGQIQDWPPVSSLYRLQASRDSEKEERYFRRLTLFHDWVSVIPELQYLKKPEYVNDLFAIIQHYGISTHYIDFTTDPGVAVFFAADTKTPPTEGTSCIYCLNTEDLISVWDMIKNINSRKGMTVELLRIDASNLWRLQAQHGVFLFADYNWTMDYGMDRIMFPYSGYPSYPSRERIYPEHKSHLEQLLDQYFFLENATFSNEEIQQRIEKLRAGDKDAAYVKWEVWSEGFYPEAFIDTSRLAPLESWSPEALRPWGMAANEDYHRSIGPTFKLNLTAGAGTARINRSVRFGMKQILREDPTIRSKMVDWVFTAQPSSLSQEELIGALRPVWNGMRRLPFTDDEIADAFGSVAALLTIGFGREASEDGEKERFSECFGACMRVSFSNWDNSGSLGWVAQESLRRAMRPDMAELLVSNYKEYVNDMHDLFKVIHNPRLIFEFSEFKSIFAREIIPAQAVLRMSPILFNPTQLLTFGIP